VNEQRKLKRRNLIYYLKVFDSKNGDLLGHLVDITLEGIMLVSAKPIEINKSFKLKMELPNEIMSKTQLIFDTTSRWSKKDINPDFIDTGFQLNTLSDKDKFIVENLISEFLFKGLDQV